MERTIIWTQPNCPLCAAIKTRLGNGNYEERPAAELISGGQPDDEAMAQLMLQDMQLPLVRQNGNFIDPAKILAQAA